MRRLLMILALLGASAADAAQRMPAEFEHDRIHLVVPAPDGSTLRAYVDSGGSMSIVAPAVAERLKLAPAGRIDADDLQATLVEFPAFLTAAGVPAPLDDVPFHGHLVLGPAPVADSDLFLGGPWLTGRTWDISYARHELYLAPEWKPSPRDHAVTLSFKTDEAGMRRLHLPRIVVTVDRQPLDMLLDTGAMARLADPGAAAWHVEPGAVVGASFIMRSVFDQWHAKHPDWRVIEQGEDFQGHAIPMMEVPQVSLGGFTVGPVWFVRRADVNFTEMMSSMMDRPVVGAFGPSGLHYFHLVLDYPNAVAWIRPEGR